LEQEASKATGALDGLVKDSDKLRLEYQSLRERSGLKSMN